MCSRTSLLSSTTSLPSTITFRRANMSGNFICINSRKSQAGTKVRTKVRTNFGTKDGRWYAVRSRLKDIVEKRK